MTRWFSSRPAIRLRRFTCRLAFLVALPDDIQRALETDELVLDCPVGTRDGVSQFARDSVGVRRLDLDADS